MEPTYDVVWPRSPMGVQAQRLAQRLDSLEGACIGLLWDWLFRGDELFPEIGAELEARFGVEIIGYEAFGNTHGGDEDAVMAALPDHLRTNEVDAVISGVGC